MFIATKAIMITPPNNKIYSAAPCPRSSLMILIFTPPNYYLFNILVILKYKYYYFSLKVILILEKIFKTI